MSRFEATLPFGSIEVTVRSEDPKQFLRDVAAFAELNTDADFLTERAGGEEVIAMHRTTSDGNEYFGFRTADWRCEVNFGQKRDAAGGVGFYPKAEKGYYERSSNERSSGNQAEHENAGRAGRSEGRGVFAPAEAGDRGSSIRTSAGAAGRTVEQGREPASAAPSPVGGRPPSSPSAPGPSEQSELSEQSKPSEQSEPFEQSAAKPRPQILATSPKERFRQQLEACGIGASDPLVPRLIRMASGDLSECRGDAKVTPDALVKTITHLDGVLAIDGNRRALIEREVEGFETAAVDPVAIKHANPLLAACGLVKQREWQVRIIGMLAGRRVSAGRVDLDRLHDLTREEWYRAEHALKALKADPAYDTPPSRFHRLMKSWKATQQALDTQQAEAA
ncbi:MAG: hypothetical protein AAFQ53_08780 [Bacteroidota bacterium]